jgi:hypothetical protein
MEQDFEYRMKFQSLVQQWHETRGGTSSIISMSMLPAYQKIIGFYKLLHPCHPERSAAKNFTIANMIGAE